MHLNQADRALATLNATIDETAPPDESVNAAAEEALRQIISNAFGNIAGLIAVGDSNRPIPQQAETQGLINANLDTILKASQVMGLMQ